MKKLIYLSAILMQTALFAQDGKIQASPILQTEASPILQMEASPINQNLIQRIFGNPQQTIEKRLKLSSVDKGVKNDSILLWGSDKMVKFIPISELGGGGVSSDLQSVLNAGSYAYLSNPETGQGTEIAFGNNNKNTLSQTNGYYTSSFSQDYYETKILSKTGNYSSNTASTLLVNQSGIGFGVEIGSWGKGGPSVSSKTATFSPFSLTGNRSYTLPDKDGTIAMLSDIPEASAGGTSPFVSINEGNGTGIVVAIQNRANTGNIGDHAVDLGSYLYAGTGDGALGQYSTISGGSINQAHGIGSVIAGGAQNTAGSSNEPYTGHYSVVSGGSANQAAGQYSVISGGAGNRANGWYSTIAGGENNNVDMGWAATISGGSYNTAYGQYATIAGGASNYAPSFCEFSAGGYGTNYTPASFTEWRATDRIFNIGNGSFNNRKNAITILKNGLATLPCVTTSLIDAEPTGKAVVTTEYLREKYIKYGTAAPLSSTDTGATGEIRLTANYIYHCVSTNIWVRSAVETTF